MKWLLAGLLSIGTCLFTVSLIHPYYYMATIKGGPFVTPTSTPPPLLLPSVASCVGNLGTGVLTANLPVTAGQGIVIFHKVIGGSLSVSDSGGNTWTPQPGVLSASGGCIDFDSTISSFTGTDTLTVQAASSGANNSIYACAVNNMTGTDNVSGGHAYTQEAIAHTGNMVSPGATGETLLGHYYIEGTSPSFSGASANSIGAGTPSDLAASGVVTNAGQAIAGAKEISTGATVGFQRSMVGGTPSDCGAIVGLVNNGIVFSPTPTPSSTPTPGPTPTPGVATINDEFVGPFATWKNVVTDFGAVGNNSHDDTANIQAGLNYLQSTGGVLYFPAGTYLISSSLNWNTPLTGDRIVGHSPADTTIKWVGGGGGTMFAVSGFLYYGEIGRLTLNGNNNVTYIVNVSNVPLGENQYVYDCVFENAVHGWYMPSNGNNDSEVFLRDTFKNLSGDGVYYNAGNSLDQFGYYNTFINNAIGMNFAWGSGGSFYSAYIGDGTDIAARILTADAFRGNVSLNSGRFLTNTSTGDDGNLFPATVQDNRIINTTQSAAINMTVPSALILLDNQIVTKAGNSGPPIAETRASGGNGAMMIGNQFTVPGPYINQNGGKVTEITDSSNAADNDRTVASSSIDQTSCPIAITSTVAGTPTFWDGVQGAQNLAVGECYPFPPNITRQCYYGGSGSHSTCGPTAADETTAGNIQGDITHACADSAAGGGTRPVIHLPANHDYQISSTLVVPAGCDVQFLGDGQMNGGGSTSSQIRWTGGNAPALQLHTPSHFHMSEMFLCGSPSDSGCNSGHGTNTGLLVDAGSPDPAGSRFNAIAIHTYEHPGDPAGNTEWYLNGLTNMAVNVLGLQAGEGSIDGGTVEFVNNGNGNSASPERLAIWNWSGGPGACNAYNSPSGSQVFSVTNQGNILSYFGDLEECTAYIPIINWNSSNTGSLLYLNNKIQTDSPNGAGASYLVANMTGSPAVVTIGSNGYEGVGDAAACYGTVAASSSPHFLYTDNIQQDYIITGVTSGYSTQNISQASSCANTGPLADQGSMTHAQIVAQFARVRVVGTGSLLSNAPSLNTVLSNTTNDIQIDRSWVTEFTREFDFEAAP